MPDDGVDDREPISAHVASTKRELRRERSRSLAGYILGGALILGVVGAAVGPPDDWGGPGWPARLEFAAMCGLGGAVGGLRFWAIDQDD